jgi:hypothetical protein
MILNDMFNFVANLMKTHKAKTIPRFPQHAPKITKMSDIRNSLGESYELLRTVARLLQAVADNFGTVADCFGTVADCFGLLWTVASNFETIAGYVGDLASYRQCTRCHKRDHQKTRHSQRYSPCLEFLSSLVGRASYVWLCLSCA